MHRYKSVLCKTALFVLILNSVSLTISRPCDLFEWPCDSGDECIKYEDRCDGIKNCADGSDESIEHCIPFSCPTYAFRCAYGACIPATSICNQRRDCVDGSDETRFLCDKNLREKEIVEILKGSCSETNSFECKSGECIHIDKRCDGKLDCSNGADETVEICSSLYCKQYKFRCGYGACIAGDLRCNGVNDCFDGSDETFELCQKHESSNKCRMPLRRDYLEFFNVNGKKVINAGDLVDFGVELRFRCFKGWHLLGAKRIFCERDGWTNPVPFCTQYCSNYSVQRGISTKAQCLLNDLEIRCNNNIPIGAIAQLRCASGYILDENARTPLNQAIRCNSDGKWNTEKLKCMPRCGLLKNTTNFDVLPWEVSIFRLEGTEYQKQCMGTIVSPKIVISAEKCFIQIQSPKPDEHELYNIITGNYAENYKPNANILRQVFNISEIVMTSNLHRSDNIAILVLVKYFDFSDTIAPVCVQFKRFTTSPYLKKPTIQGQGQKTQNLVSTDFGAGSYELNNSVYFLKAVIGGRTALNPINIVNFDSVIKKYIERYYSLI